MKFVEEDKLIKSSVSPSPSPSLSCEFPSGDDVPLEAEEHCVDAPRPIMFLSPRWVKSQICRALVDSVSLDCPSDASLVCVEEELGGEEVTVGSKWMAVRPDTNNTHLEGGSERTGGREGVREGGREGGKEGLITCPQFFYRQVPNYMYRPRNVLIAVS